MSDEPLPFCGIPGHPPVGHGSHHGCITHGDMRYRPSGPPPGDGPLACCAIGECEPDPDAYHRRAYWICLGFDGEGCNLPPVPDAFPVPRLPVN